MGRLSVYRFMVVSMAVILSVAFFAGRGMGGDGIDGPDAGFEEVGDICSDIAAEYEDARADIEDAELQDAKPHAGKMVYLSARLAAFAPARKHAEFKKYADKLKEQSLAMEEACIGYDQERAMAMVAEIRQTCHSCHGLY